MTTNRRNHIPAPEYLTHPSFTNSDSFMNFIATNSNTNCLKAFAIFITSTAHIQVNIRIQHSTFKFIEKRFVMRHYANNNQAFRCFSSFLNKPFNDLCYAVTYTVRGKNIIGIQGHPPELSDSVKLFLSDAKRHGFEIDHALKSIDWHFLYKNFSHFGQVVCLLHKFEVTQLFYHFTDCPSNILNSACIHFHFLLLFMI